MELGMNRHFSFFQRKFQIIIPRKQNVNHIRLLTRENRSFFCFFLSNSARVSLLMNHSLGDKTIFFLL